MTHFGHNNIIKYCNRPERHDALMYANWFRTVSIDDTILHLGDLTFKSSRDIPISRLPGKKYLILGNHDHKSVDWYENEGFKVIDPFVWNKIAFTHAPLSHNDEWNTGINHNDWDINIHGHIHNNSWNNTYEGMFTKKQYINVSVEVMNYTPVKLGEILNG